MAHAHARRRSTRWAIGLLQRAATTWSEPCSQSVRSFSSSRDFQLPGWSYPTAKKLKDIVKLPLLAMEDNEMIEEIWTERHASAKGAVGTTFSEDKLRFVLSRTQRCPMFVFPVFRDGGHFVMLSQFDGLSCAFTFLDDYKKDPVTAMPWMATTMHDDLCDRQKPVLVRSDFSTPHLLKEEASYLMEAMLRSYVHENMYSKVEAFNHNQPAFDINRHFGECKQLFDDLDLEASRAPSTAAPAAGKLGSRRGTIRAPDWAFKPPRQ